MNRIYKSLALIGVLGCSSENSRSETLLTEATDGSSDVFQSTGGSLNSRGSPGGAPSLSGTGGSLGFSDGSISSPSAADLPGKLAPTRETAQALLDRLAVLYQDYAAAADPQGSHRITGRIKDGDPVAHTHVRVGQEWEILVTPGWLALPKMTVDVLALSSCHEMGHFVGGFPFKGPRRRVDDGTAVAAEGQADYFATKDCLPRLWAEDGSSNAAAFAELDSSQRELCTKAHSDPKSQALCGRILITALQAAQIYHEEAVKQSKRSNSGEGKADPDGVTAEGAADPKLETPDPSVVPRTYTAHSNAQCRLDTMVAGVLCDVKAVGTTIPGYVPPYGRFSAASQDAARPFACQDGPGARPKCWFHPNTQEFDCTEFQAPQCVMQNGHAAIRSCDPIAGLTYFQCQMDQICRPDADGNPECVSDDE
jgi:hypothetical protein